MRSRPIAVVAAAVLTASLASAQPASAQSSASEGRSAHARSDLRLLPPALARAMAGRGIVGAPPASALPGGRALLSGAKAASLHACAFDDSMLCGKITPPLDRDDLSFGATNVRFVVAPHTGSDPDPTGAIFTTSGGPGNSITGSNGEMYPFRDYVLAALRGSYDMVFIDQRGVGRSDALSCPGLQHKRETYRLAGACARRFGATRNFYSSAAVADDTDDIRAALGYDQIVAMGGSYGGNDAVTYAMRHPDHTALVVAGSPAMPLGPFDQFSATTPKAIPGYVSRLCERSVECAKAYPHPWPLIRQLVERVREHPVVGVGYDNDGRPHHMRVTESLLLWWVLQDSDFPFYAGQTVQAAAALKAGDKVPLLRLAAQHDPATRDGDSGPERDFSAAENLLRYCTDASFPWDVTAPRADRRQQYGDAVAAEPERYGIFSRDAWDVGLPTGFFPDPCIAARWEHVPEFPPGPVAGVDTLVLSGDYDLVVPTAYAAQVTDLLTDSTLIEVKGAAHNPWFWRRCAVGIVDHFIRTGDPTDLCAGKRLPRYWEPGSFPTKVAAAPQARSRPGDESTAGDRRIATVATWALLDAINMAFRAEGTDSRGLRGGTIHAVYPAGPPTPFRYHLHGVRFTEDTAVTGVGSWDWSNVLGGTVSLSAPGVGKATLSFAGQFYTNAQRVIRVHGKIDGRTIRVTVPAY